MLPSNAIEYSIMEYHGSQSETGVSAKASIPTSSRPGGRLAADIAPFIAHSFGESLAQCQVEAVRKLPSGPPPL